MSYKTRGVKYETRNRWLYCLRPVTLVTPVTPRPLPEKAFRRKKAGRYSVKKSVLSERSEFTDFRNIARLFSFWRFGA